MANLLSTKRHLIPDSLVHSTGTITATFGSTSYAVALSGLAANTLHFLYLRSVSGTVTLVYVTTTPASYRLSFPDAILIGAFYSNGQASIAFGSFVNIVGPPSTSIIQFVPVVRTNAGGGIANFSAAPTGHWMRNGHKLYWSAGFGTSSGGLTGTAGSLIINGPTNLSGSSGGTSDGVLGSLAGHFTVESFSPNSGGAFYVFTGSDVSLMKSTSAVMQLSDFTTGVNPLVKVEIGCGGFSETPLVDL